MGQRDQTTDPEQRKTAENSGSLTDADKAADASLANSADVVIPITSRVVGLLCLVILGPWFIMVAGMMSRAEQSPPQLPTPSTSTVRNSPEVDVSSELLTESESRWGRLSQTRIKISPPIEFIEELDTSKVGSDWHFSNAWSMKLDELLASFGIEQPVRDELSPLSESSLDEVIHVTNEVLEKIPLTTRAKVYDHLAQDPRNVDQFNAFRFCGGSVDDWFQRSKLRPELVERIKTMVYSRGPVLFFSDLRLILPHLQNERERVRLLKVLSRESTRLVRLHVDKDSDIEALVDYWGRYGRAKDVRPILESLALKFKGGSIDIVHLLPPFARERIYTYPGTANGNSVVRRNSHWTALNFFGEETDDRYTSLSNVGEALHTDYYPISGEPSFGDLVCFTDKNGELFHTAVYIADDILYTKNSYRVSRPWMLLSTDEMLHFYPRLEPPTIRYFRRNDS